MRARSHQPLGRGPLVAHAARGSTTSKTLMLGRCRQYGDSRLLEVMEERNGPSGLRDDDDDDDEGGKGFLGSEGGNEQSNLQRLSSRP